MRTLEARLLGYDSDGSPINYKKIAGLSTETKPTTGLCTGSEFLEIDTGKTNYFIGRLSPKSNSNPFRKT